MKLTSCIKNPAIYLYLMVVLVLCVGCVDSKPSTKYSIYVPSRSATSSGGRYDVNTYKSFENGTIEFRVENQIHRATDFNICVNY